MAYKTLFSALSDPDLMPSLIDQSAALARKYDAHFDALCLGVDRTQAGYYYGGGNAMVIQQSLERAHDEVKALTEEAERRLHTQDILWGLDNGVTQLADMGRHIGNRARFSDLGIAARPYGEGMGIELEGIVEAMLFDGGIPVMVIPTEAKPIVTPKVITLAWNESPEALAATRAALPILQEADRVRVAVIDPRNMAQNDPIPVAAYHSFWPATVCGRKSTCCPKPCRALQMSFCAMSRMAPLIWWLWALMGIRASARQSLAVRQGTCWNCPPCQSSWHIKTQPGFQNTKGGPSGPPFLYSSLITDQANIPPSLSSPASISRRSRSGTVT